MTRGGFFKALFGSAAVVAVPAVGLAKTSTGLGEVSYPPGYWTWKTKGLIEIPSDHEVRRRFPEITHLYRGYGLLWTGWKTSQFQMARVGQWYATHLETFFTGGSHKMPFAYSSYPGIVTGCNLGDSINVCVQEGQDKIAYNFHLCTPEEIEAAKKDALDKLLKFINENGI